MESSKKQADHDIEFMKAGLQMAKARTFPEFDYTATHTVAEINEYFSHITTFVASMDTIDFEIAQKIMFIRLQIESLYNQFQPFLSKVAELEKQT